MKIEVEHIDEAEFEEWLISPGGVRCKELIDEVSAIIERQTVDSDSVSIVITGRFNESVESRSPGGPGEAYDNERLAGLAAAKTMPRPDGSIDVVIPGVFFVGLDDESPSAITLRTQLLIYLAEHEAQHVGMGQRGESLTSSAHEFAGGMSATRFTTSAAIVADEYRAELAAVTRRGVDQPYWKSVPESLGSIKPALLDALKIRYPGESMERPMSTAYLAAHETWVTLAYLAAHTKVDGDIQDVPHELSSSNAWRRYVGTHWGAFGEILNSLPPGNSACDRDVLKGRVIELSELFRLWFNTFGFDLRDTGSGMYFDVLRHDF